MNVDDPIGPISCIQHKNSQFLLQKTCTHYIFKYFFDSRNAQNHQQRYTGCILTGWRYVRDLLQNNEKK